MATRYRRKQPIGNRADKYFWWSDHVNNVLNGYAVNAQGKFVLKRCFDFFFVRTDGIILPYNETSSTRSKINQSNIPTSFLGEGKPIHNLSFSEKSLAIERFNSMLEDLNLPEEPSPLPS